MLSDKQIKAAIIKSKRMMPKLIFKKMTLPDTNMTCTLIPY